MAQYSWFWDGIVTGDATLAPYSSTEFSSFMRHLLNADRTTMGPIAGIDNELAVSGAATPLTVATGAALVLGKLYQNTAAATIAVPAPAVSTRNDVIVLEHDTGAQTIRIARQAGVEGGGVPALTQTDAVWQIPLAYAAVTTAGVITLTDMRSFARTPLGPGYKWAYLAADDPDFTAAAWNDLNAGVTMTLTVGTWLIWGQVNCSADGTTAGNRSARIYNNNSAHYVTASTKYLTATESGFIHLPPRVYTVTAANVLKLQFYAAHIGDIVYGGIADNTDDYTTMVALRVA